MRATRRTRITGVMLLGALTGGSLAWLTPSGGMPTAFAQEKQPPGGSNVLPAPEPPFKGTIGESYKDSKQDFPAPVKAPAGAPNVVLIMLDDVGFGHTSTFGGPIETARRSGGALQPPSHDGHLLARFTIPTPALLAKVVDMLDHVPMEERDTKGDVYEYMLAKIATAGQNGQFRTPRHIIRLMVELTAPQPTDVICDPACGTAGFLVAAGEYLRERHPNLLHDKKQNKHFHHRMFHGFDFDNTMLRIGSMNMLLHGVESPDIRYRDSLAQDHAGEEEKYTLVLANPPFAGSLDYENTAKDLLQIVKTKKTELLFLALLLRLLKPGGRAAVIVPDGVLFGSSKAHKELRRILVEDQKLDAVVSLPGGVGACVEVKLEDGVLHRQVSPTRSYLSQVELPVTFGLGLEDQVRRVTVTWPDGSRQEVDVDGVDTTYEVRQLAESPSADSQVQRSTSEPEPGHAPPKQMIPSPSLCCLPPTKSPIRST